MCRPGTVCKLLAAECGAHGGPQSATTAGVQRGKDVLLGAQGLRPSSLLCPLAQAWSPMRPAWCHGRDFAAPVEGQAARRCIPGMRSRVLLCSPNRTKRVLYPQAMHDVVARCLQKDPALRPTAEELLRHKFFKVCGARSAPKPALSQSCGRTPCFVRAA
jgi:serine/threonine protein kinase